MSAKPTLVVLLVTLTGVACSGSDATTTSLSDAPTTAPREVTSTSTTSTLPPTSKTIPTASEVPSGFKQFGGAEVGFTMWVPEGWVALGGEDFDPEAIAEATSSFDPAIVEMVESLFASGAVLFAMNPAPVDGFNDNINVIQNPSSGFTAEDLVDPLASHLEQTLGATDVLAATVETAAGEAVRVSYTLPQLGNEGVIFQVFTEDADWVVTFSAAEVDTIGFDIDELIDSFQPTP